MKRVIFIILTIAVCLLIIPFGFISCASSGSSARETARFEAEILEQQRLEEQRQAEARAAREAEEAQRAEERRLREEERQQPRFSAEGEEYIKRTLIQAVGESRNQANWGKTLFFESSLIRVRETPITGQYLVDEVGSSGNVIMEFYGRIPINLAAGLLGGYGRTILYRVEISQWGNARFLIDSFRE
jgi:hypothetical protein